MGFLDKLMFWKKDDFPDLNPPGMGMDDRLDFGDAGRDHFPSTQGFSDVGNYRGSGDFQSRQEMGQSLRNQYTDFGSNQGYQVQKPLQYHEVNEQPQNNHEMQIVSAKLDAIKATLDALNQRIANLEASSYTDRERRRNQW